MFPPDAPISEQSGRALAEWARGSTPPSATVKSTAPVAATAPSSGSEPPAEEDGASLDLQLQWQAEAAAIQGTKIYQGFFLNELTKDQRAFLQDKGFHERNKKSAQMIDEKEGLNQ